MTFDYSAAFPVRPGAAERLVAALTASHPGLADAGCLRYDVGTSPDAPDTVFVHESWVSREAHDASLGLPSTRAAIAQAMPLIAGRPATASFEVLGSPLA